MKPFVVLLLCVFLLPSLGAQQLLLNESPDVENFRMYLNQVLAEKRVSLAKANQDLPGVSFFLSPQIDVIRVVVETKVKDGARLRKPLFTLAVKDFVKTDEEAYASEIVKDIDATYQKLSDYEQRAHVLCTKDQVAFKGTEAQQLLAQKVHAALEKASPPYLAALHEKITTFLTWNSSLFESDGKAYILITAIVANNDLESDALPIAKYRVDELDDKTIETIGTDIFDTIVHEFMPDQTPPEESEDGHPIVKNLAPLPAGLVFSGFFRAD